ncbi:Pyruvate formate-lyase [Georgfuchsia toluolica]|uniref:Pyruvate formate-lyase n=1 Tax=Georgfuchsia toluolica TaxID=424218 RepID=A0A916J720_9PROT|nr:pyruvate formate lyase family protein [Georgfuchsia toluolica]CAG4885139.1 Pyruvate formate-lyase [Georgfuchsia toluolica]
MKTIDNAADSKVAKRVVKLDPLRAKSARLLQADSTDSKPTKRVQRMMKQLRSEPIRVSCERLRPLIDTYKEFEGAPETIKMARVLERSLVAMTIFIDESPIVGTITKYPVGASPFPELACKWMLKEKAFATSLGEIVVSDKDKEVLKEAIAYFDKRCLWSKSLQTIRQMYPDADPITLQKIGLVDHSPPSLLSGLGILDFGKVLNIGLEGVIAEIRAEMAKLGPWELESYRKREFLQASEIALTAIIKFAERYSRLAAKMAAEESEGVRKKELEKIAETCAHVPAKPARTFFEAAQSFWFMHLMPWFEGVICGSPGRFPQYMYPFYAQDKKEGRITEEEALELIEIIFVKIAAIQNFEPDDLYKTTQGTTHQILSLGGYDANGDDATNIIDFLCLEAQKVVKSTPLSVTVLYHDKLSEEFLMKCVELIRSGGGNPQFHNARVFLERALTSHPGIPLAHARDTSMWGCQDMVINGRGYLQVRSIFNSAKLVELALNNGVDPLSGKLVGPQTGKAESFKSYEEFAEAVRKQAAHFVPLTNAYHSAGQYIKSKYFPNIVQSALTEGCIEKGRHLYEGGAQYNTCGTVFIGTVDLANSMSAVKKVVFDDKKITMGQMLQALKDDFEGKDGERIRKLLLAAPKVGNDDDYADGMARDWYEVLYQLHQNEMVPPTPDFVLRPEAYSATNHFGRGRFTGALPTGRKATIPLTDASVSPMPGTECEGPTAVVKSAAKVLDCVKWGSNHLNLKFLPAMLEGTENARHLLSLLKTYMDLGGSHMQVNCVSSETLRDAQAHPENYRDLVVRVAGFSAYFTLLDVPVQNEIIARSSFGWE